MLNRFAYFHILALGILLASLPASNAGAEKAESSASRAATSKVDLNTATKAQLQELPGVGPATADAIIAARPFAKLDDLKNVQGIGDAKFNQLRGLVTVSRAPKSASVAATDPKVRTASKIDLNSADAATLATLPGVGPTVAQAIIAARPLKSVEDLKQIKGIGDARFNEIRPLVTVRSSAARPSGAGVAPNSSRSVSAADGSVSKSRSQSVPTQGKININTASKEELETLKGIGDVKAQAIIDGRPYKSIDDIMRVKGIKEGVFAEIKDQIKVR
jgi:competence protein ComEA